MQVIIQPHSFDPYEALSKYQNNLRSGRYGAVVSFVGVMRDFNEDESVTAMTLEHYPGMTEKEIERICQEALSQYPIDDLLVIHRVGDITPNEPIVLVVVWSAHRSAAFDSCREIINQLKQRAPFWKREQGEQGPRWVSGNTQDPALTNPV
ncbi:Molybdopterin synthase catalytic subunit MoaE [hydrothermal vent metagenome]|uniref:Molybdopterin synthase catalytic subunit MoaE n=1 Tax=hydrothermal vent metagenome TaxID=652676 RepID=A0A3B0ZNN5_9ZZZZ